MKKTQIDNALPALSELGAPLEARSFLRLDHLRSELASQPPRHREEDDNCRYW